MNDGGNPPVTRPDPIRSLELLWGIRAPATRGSKPGLTIDDVVNAAIAIADVDGLAGLSMRRVADRLDVGTMSLYRYVPAKAELLDLMFDRVSNETARPDDAADGWRGRLEQIARENLALYARHPVAPGPREFPSAARSRRDRQVRLRVAGHRRHRPVRCGDGFGARAPPRVRPERGRIACVAWMRVPDETGQTDDEWWLSIAPTLEQVLDVDRYAVAVRVGTASTEEYRGLHDPTQAFEFGLERVLDGIAVLIEQI